MESAKSQIYTLQEYQQIPSLQEYVMVSTETPGVTVLSDLYRGVF